MNGRFPCFAPKSHISAQKSSKIRAIYHHPHSHQRGNQDQFLITDWRVAAGQVGKGPKKTRPIIYLQQEIRKLDLRKHAVGHRLL